MHGGARSVVSFSFLALLAGAAALVGPVCSATGNGPPSADSVQGEREIRELDERERLAMLQVDPEAQALWAEHFLVTNTLGEVLSREEILEVLGAGIVPYRAFEREVESVRLYGDVAVSIGSEVVVPRGAPADRRIPRRYTHVWVRGEEGWRLVARHASEVPVHAEGWH